MHLFKYCTLFLAFAICSYKTCFATEVVAQKYDVVVYGGTPCGIISAIAASREGSRVLLIEPTKHVGGLSTSGINTAETEHMLKWTIGGIALEFYKLMGEKYQTHQPEFYFESSVAEKCYLEMLEAAKITIKYDYYLTKVQTHSGHIDQIQLNDDSTYEAKVFIDASYEGDLAHQAGVPMVFGRESKSDYNEEAAGIRFDKKIREAVTVDEKGNLLPGISAWAKDLKEGDSHPLTMNYNFRLTFAKDPALRVEIPTPKHYDRGRYALLDDWLQKQTAAKKSVKLMDILDLYARRHGKYEVNNRQDAVISLGHFGGQLGYPAGDIATREKIIADHWDYTLGLLYFLAHDESVPENVRAEMLNWGLHKDEFTDNHNLPYQLYVREAMRMRGMYVMTQQDVQTDRRKSDSIGLSSHFIDCHHCQRVALTPTSFVNEGRIWRMGYAYQIPYRSLVPQPKDATNLIVPCAASYTHVAYCTLRLESVWMIMGHAAGVAAAMAIESDKPVQDIDVTKLQDKLRTQQQVVDFVPGLPEKCEKINGPPEF
jgi:hypothetical protein